MADNKTTTTTVSTVPSGTVIATDEIGGVDYQRVKLACGPDGTATDVPVGGGVEAAALRVTIASDSTGVLSIDDNGGSLTVDGTVAVTLAAGATAIAKAEDVASADADVGVPAMAVRKATPANTSGADGDYEFLQMSAGRLWTSTAVDTALPAGTNAIGKLAANSGVDIGDVDVTTCGTITPGTAATNLGKAEDAAHTTGDVGVMALSVRSNTAAATSGTDGDYQPLITDTNGRLHVVNSAGVAGDVAHDAADSGNPVKVGGVARQTNPTAVADADRVNATYDDLGRQVVVLSQVRDLTGHQHTQIASSSSETTIVTAVASTFLDLTSLVLTNQTATAVNCTIKDSTAGTTRMIIALPASGGAVLNFPVPVTQSATNNNWTCTLSSAAVTVNIFAQFCKNV